MALVKFYRGKYAKYDSTKCADGVFFASDKQLIIMNGVEYGGVNMSQFEGFIKDVDVEGQNLTFKKDVDGKWVDVTIKLLAAADSSIELGTITDGGVNDGSTIKVKAVYDTNADGDGLKLDETNGIKVVLDKTRSRLETIEGDDTTTGSIKKALKDAKAYTDAEIDKLDAQKVGGEGKVITTISETNGVISATAIELKAENVAATAIEKGDDTIAVDGKTVAAQVASLGKSVKSALDSAATYTVKKLTEGLASNVKEAYQLVQTLGNGTTKDIDVQIPIYKDSSLKSVELVDEDTTQTPAKKGQFLKFTYITDEGTESIVYLDCSKFLVESEFKDGLQVNTSGEVSVKVEDVSASETQYLSVSDKGVKVSGIDAAITAAKTELIGGADADYDTMGELEARIKEVDAKASAAHTKVNAKADGHVTVTVKEKTDEKTQTKYSEVTVAENDIASDADLQKEIAARKAVDGQSGQTYTANANANYIDSAASLNDADVKLDAALKAEADRAAAAEDKIEASVGLATDGSHVTTTGHYTSKATTIASEIAAVDAQAYANEEAIKVLNGADTVKGSVAKSIKDAVEALDVEAVGGNGKYITTVSEADGKIKAVAADLTATATAFISVTGSDATLAVEGDNVQAAIESLAKNTATALSWIDLGEY